MCRVHAFKEDASCKCINSMLLLSCTGTDPGFLERGFKFTKVVWFVKFTWTLIYWFFMIFLRILHVWPNPLWIRIWVVAEAWSFSFSRSKKYNVFSIVKRDGDSFTQVNACYIWLGWGLLCLERVPFWICVSVEERCLIWIHWHT